LKLIENKTLAEVALRKAAVEETEKISKVRMRQLAATTEGPSRLSLSETPTYTYGSTPISSTYVPMTWDANDTVVLTWTITAIDVNVSAYDYTTTIPGYTYVDNSTANSFLTSISSPSSPSSTACTAPIISFSLSNMEASSVNGEVVHIVGSAS